MDEGWAEAIPSTARACFMCYQVQHLLDDSYLGMSMRVWQRDTHYPDSSVLCSASSLTEDNNRCFLAAG